MEVAPGTTSMLSMTCGSSIVRAEVHGDFAEALPMVFMRWDVGWDDQDFGGSVIAGRSVRILG